MRRRSKFTLTAGVSIVLVALVWIIFAPSQLGGATSYVIVDGNSMDPTYHRGDLVLVRQADSYNVGDIVTYRHPQIGPVIHRIIGRDGSRYVFQGDNNSFVDGYHPTEAELIGKEWVHIPGIGKALTGARSPRNLAILVALVGVIVMSSFIGSERKTEEATATAEPARPEPDGPSPLVEALKLLAVAAFAAALVAGISFSRPLRTPSQTDVPYTQQVAFHYSAATSGAGQIYDNGAASSGEPIFRQVSDSVDVGFRYTFSSNAANDISGTWRLVAEVSDVNGWRRTIPLQPETPFQGTEIDGSATLKFADVQSLIDQVESRTSVERSQYHLTIAPEIHLTGSLAGVDLAEDYAPQLEFLFDDLQLQMADAKDPASALTPSEDGLVNKRIRVPNTLGVLAWHIDVGLARTWSLVVLAGSVVLGLTLLLILAGARAGRGRASRRSARRASDTETIEVRAWADLLALSRRLDTPVKSDVYGRYRRYYIEANNFTWQFFDISAPAEPAQ